MTVSACVKELAWGQLADDETSARVIGKSIVRVWPFIGP